MIEYFHLFYPESQRLLGSDSANPYAVTLCPVADHRSVRRVREAAIEVSHSKRDQLMIWLVSGEVAVHRTVLLEMENQRVSGYRSRPATVQFRDGSVSTDYSEIIVTGWAGVAPVESGIRLVEECPGCHRKRYSGLQDSDKVIDWTQWTGDDFFIVWPLPKYILITKRIVDILTAMNVKSYRLGGLRRYENRNIPVSRQGFAVPPLSNFMPEDLALQYGGRLGLA